MTLSRVVVLPTKMMRLTKYCLPSSSAHRDVDDRLGARLDADAGAAGRPRRRRRRHRRSLSAAPSAASRVFGSLGNAYSGHAGELEVAAAAVDLARLLEALADHLLVEPVALLDLEQRPQPFGLDDGVAGEVDVADLVARPFGDRNLQLRPSASCRPWRPRGSSARGCPICAFDVAALAVVRLHLVGVVFELAFLVGAVAGDRTRATGCAPCSPSSCVASLPSVIALLPWKSTSRIRTFGPSVMWKVRLTVLVAALTGLISGLTSTYS